MSSNMSNTGKPTTGWVGWLIFAAILLVINGALTAIQGLAALFRDESYFLTDSGHLLTFNFTTWGWIHLIIGLALIAIGVMLIRGSFVATVLTGVVVAINLVSQFAWIGAYPWWSLTVIAVDILILYAIFVHGGELGDD